MSRVTRNFEKKFQECSCICRAIADGIISQTRGLYVNPDTGDSMPIPEAMDKGLILVEFTNSSIERENIQKGILTTTTTREDITYTVQVKTNIVTHQEHAHSHTHKNKAKRKWTVVAFGKEGRT